MTATVQKRKAKKALNILVWGLLGLAFSTAKNANANANNDNTNPYNYFPQANPYMQTQSPVMQYGYGIVPDGTLSPSIPTVINSQVQNYISGQLTPEQINQLKTLGGAQAQALASPYPNTPNFGNRTIVTNPADNKTPPVVATSQGFISTIVFLDEEGHAWEIESVTGDTSIFNITVPENQSANTQTQNQAPATSFESSAGVPDEVLYRLNPDGSVTPVSTSQLRGQQGQANAQQVTQSSMGGGAIPKKYIRYANTIQISPKTAYRLSNLVVQLKGAKLPVVLYLTAQGEQTDALLKVFVSGDNPDGARNGLGVGFGTNFMGAGAPRPFGYDQQLFNILNGEIPDDFVQLQSSDSAVTAWQYDDYIYIKTRLHPLSPSFDGKLGYGDNETHIYRYNMKGKRNMQFSFTQRNGGVVNVSLNEIPYYAR